MPGNPYDITTRAQVVALKAHGVTVTDIIADTGVSAGGIKHIWNKAIKRGYDPKKSRVVKDMFLVDGKRSGRPRKEGERNDKGKLIRHEKRIPKVAPGEPGSVMIMSGTGNVAVAPAGLGAENDEGMGGDGMDGGMGVLREGERDSSTSVEEQLVRSLQNGNPYPPGLQMHTDFGPPGGVGEPINRYHDQTPSNGYEHHPYPGDRMDHRQDAPPNAYEHPSAFAPEARMGAHQHEPQRPSSSYDGSNPYRDGGPLGHPQSEGAFARFTQFPPTAHMGEPNHASPIDPRLGPAGSIQP